MYEEKELKIIDDALIFYMSFYQMKEYDLAKDIGDSTNNEECKELQQELDDVIIKLNLIKDILSKNNKA